MDEALFAPMFFQEVDQRPSVMEIKFEEVCKKVIKAHDLFMVQHHPVRTARPPKYPMRKFINIVESHGAPSPMSIVTPAMADTIIERGAWTTHGSDLYRFVEEQLGEEGLYDPDEDGDADEFIHSWRFKGALLDWMNRRAGWVAAATSGLTPQSILERTMYVDANWIASLSNDQTAPLGVFWADQATNNWEPGESQTHLGPIYIRMETTMADVTVNWIETYLSRFDWELGDDEAEIQLVNGAAIKEVRMYDESGGMIAVNPDKKFTA